MGGRYGAARDSENRRARAVRSGPEQPGAAPEPPGAAPEPPGAASRDPTTMEKRIQQQAGNRHLIMEKLTSDGLK